MTGWHPCAVECRVLRQFVPWGPRDEWSQIAGSGPHRVEPQNCFFNADTGKAFTTVLAGLAFTITTLPNTSLLPALVAGFKRVLTMQTPGTTNLPTPFTWAAAISASVPTTLAHSFLFSSHSPARASARAPLLMGLAPTFIAFMAFMGAISKS